MPLTRPNHNQINTASTKFTDPLLEVNADLAGANANDMGLIMNRGTSGDNVAVIWDRSVEEFALCTTTATGDSSGNITIAGYANLHVNQIVTAGLTYPTTDGVNGQVLTTDGSGGLSFASIPAEVNDLTAAVTWATVPDAYITQSSVTQHQAALSITESQISNLGTTAMVNNQSNVPTVNNTYNLGSATFSYNTVYATTFAGEATSAQYADLAENYAGDYQYIPGTVLSFGGDAEVTECKEEHSCNIVGVVSSDPGLIMNSKLDAEFIVPVALMGRVPCKVFGPVKRGDLMVSAGHGAARAEDNPKYGSIIGRAIEDFDGPSGVIEVLVGRV